MTDTSTSKLVGKALIVSEDAVNTRLLSEAMEELALSVEVCGKIGTRSTGSVTAKLRSLSLTFRWAIRPSYFWSVCAPRPRTGPRSHSPSRTIAPKLRPRLKGGSAFTLQKPLTIESIRHTFKAAYGLIVRERRRYFRYPISVPAAASRKGQPEIFGRTINISEKGMALSTSTPLTPGSEFKIQFTLPDPHLDITADCKVCWHNDQGQAGLSFLFLPSNLGSELQAWLARKLEEQLPDVVTRKFQSSPT